VTYGTVDSNRVAVRLNGTPSAAVIATRDAIARRQPVVGDRRKHQCARRASSGVARAVAGSSQVVP